MVTVKINDRTKDGKALFEFLKIYSAKSKGVEIIETEIKAKRNKDAPISKNIPNAETLKAFRDNDKKGTKSLKKFDTVDALFEDAGI